MTSRVPVRRPACLHVVILAIAAFAGCAPAPAFAQEEPSVDARLTVRVAGDRTTFVPGELIPLELVFTRTGDYDFYFSTETHDRSGRLDTEQYVVTPTAGVEDPLADYLESFPAVAGSGLRDIEPLQGSPFTLRVYLNEWVAFTQPGEYELVVTSSRLRRYSGRQAPQLRSDVVRLRIEPAPAGWAEAELARAEAAVATGEPEQVQAGITILRHLRTREAALALVRHYSVAQSRFDVFAGLIASPFRVDIVAAMEAQLETGRTLPQDYIRELAILRTLLDNPAGTIDTSLRMERVAAVETEYRRRWLDALMSRLVAPRLVD